MAEIYLNLNTPTAWKSSPKTMGSNTELSIDGGSNEAAVNNSILLNKGEEPPSKYS